MTENKKWRAGQIVTIGGIIFRVMRYKRGEYCACDHCYFNIIRVGCALHVQSPTIGMCISLVPNDCYFKRLSPIIIMR